VTALAGINDLRVEPHGAKWIVRSESGSVDEESFDRSIARTDLLSQHILSWTFLPIALAASTYATPNLLEVVHKYQQKLTTLQSAGMNPTAVEEAEWRYVAEPIDHAQIEELKRIWALPYRGDVDFDFRSDAE